MNQRRPALPLGGRAILTLKTLRKSFGSLRVIDDLDLEVEGGEALGIIGPNGAGKSTLFNLVAGLFKPDAARSRSMDARSQRRLPKIAAPRGSVVPFRSRSRSKT